MNEFDAVLERFLTRLEKKLDAHLLQSITATINKAKEEILNELENLIAQLQQGQSDLQTAETNLETKLDLLITTLEANEETLQNTIASLQANGASPTDIQNLQSVLTAQTALKTTLQNFVPAPTITLTPVNPTVQPGAQQQFSANVPGTWAVTSANSSTIDPNAGLYTAGPNTGASPLTDTVTFTASDGSGTTATTTVTIPPATPGGGGS